MFAEFPGQSRATCDLIEKVANQLVTTDIPDSFTNGERFISVFFGGEMIDARTYSGGYTVELSKIYKRSQRLRIEKVGTRYERIDFFTSGHVPIYKECWDQAELFEGYNFGLYENMSLDNSGVEGSGYDVPAGFRWSNSLNTNRIRALINTAPVFHVTVPAEVTNAFVIGRLFSRLHSRIKAVEQRLKDQENAEEDRRISQATEEAEDRKLKSARRALDFFKEPPAQSGS